MLALALRNCIIVNMSPTRRDYMYHIILFLACCYVVAKAYKVLYICDIVPPCGRAHVHMLLG